MNFVIYHHKKWKILSMGYIKMARISIIGCRKKMQNLLNYFWEKKNCKICQMVSREKVKSEVVPRPKLYFKTYFFNISRQFQDTLTQLQLFLPWLYDKISDFFHAADYRNLRFSPQSTMKIANFFLDSLLKYTICFCDHLVKFEIFFLWLFAEIHNSFLKMFV